MGCLGKLCAKQASKQPIKRYNTLVPDIFPADTLNAYEPLPASVVRKIEKVQNYAVENLQNAPKVSRRIDRRITAAVKGNQAGTVKVGVHALIYLLAKGKTEDSSLYAKEVISGDSAVVARLLDDVRSSSGTTEPLPTLGLELLVHFIHAQADGDFFQHIEDLIPRVCQRLERTGEEGQENTAAALRVLREFVALVRRITHSTAHLRLVTVAALTHTQDRAPPPTLPRVLDTHFVGTLACPQDCMSADSGALARSVVHELGLLCPDATIGSEVIDSVLGDVSERSAWADAARPGSALAVLADSLRGNALQHMLFGGLLKHVASPAVGTGQQAPALKYAAKLAAELAPSYTLPSLVSALALLPRVLRRAFQGKDKAAIQATNRSILAVLRALVSSVQGTHPVLDVVSSVFETRDRSDADSLGLLKCCEIVAQLLHERVTSEPDEQARSAQQIARLPTVLLSELLLLMEPQPLVDASDSRAPLALGAVRSIPLGAAAYAPPMGVGPAGTAAALLTAPASAVVSGADAGCDSTMDGTDAATAPSVVRLKEQASANEILASLLPLCQQPLKAGQVEQLQRVLYEQLGTTRVHSPRQIASAGNLIQQVVERSPPSTLVDTCRVLLTTVRAASNTPRKAHDGLTSCHLVQITQVCTAGVEKIHAVAGCGPAPAALADMQCPGVTRESGRYEPVFDRPVTCRCRLLMVANAVTTDAVDAYCKASATAVLASPLVRSAGGPHVDPADMMTVSPEVMLSKQRLLDAEADSASSNRAGSPSGAIQGLFTADTTAHLASQRSPNDMLPIQEVEQEVGRSEMSQAVPPESADGTSMQLDDAMALLSGMGGTAAPVRPAPAAAAPAAPAAAAVPRRSAAASPPPAGGSVGSGAASVGGSAGRMPGRAASPATSRTGSHTHTRTSAAGSVSGSATGLDGTPSFARPTAASLAASMPSRRTLTGDSPPPAKGGSMSSQTKQGTSKAEKVIRSSNGSTAPALSSLVSSAERHTGGHGDALQGRYLVDDDSTVDASDVRVSAGGQRRGDASTGVDAPAQGRAAPTTLRSSSGSRTGAGGVPGARASGSRRTAEGVAFGRSTGATPRRTPSDRNLPAMGGSPPSAVPAAAPPPANGTHAGGAASAAAADAPVPFGSAEALQPVGGASPAAADAAPPLRSNLSSRRAIHALPSAAADDAPLKSADHSSSGAVAPRSTAVGLDDLALPNGGASGPQGTRGGGVKFAQLGAGGDAVFRERLLSVQTGNEMHEAADHFDTVSDDSFVDARSNAMSRMSSYRSAIE